MRDKIIDMEKWLAQQQPNWNNRGKTAMLIAVINRWLGCTVPITEEKTAI